jgi:Flp pilus assembly protein TadG
MLAALRTWRRSGYYSLLGRFRKKEDGAAAVEFALVALPFFGLIFAVIELAIFFFASRFLEDGLFNASRKVLTQRLDSATICSAFKTEVEAQLSGWFVPSKLTLSITPLSSFSASGTAVDFASGTCSFGGTGQTMLVRASYAYPFKGFRFISGSTLIGKDIGLTASTAFRVE